MKDVGRFVRDKVRDPVMVRAKRMFSDQSPFVNVWNDVYHAIAPCRRLLPVESVRQWQQNCINPAHDSTDRVDR